MDVEDEDAGISVTVVVEGLDAIAPSPGEFDEPEAHAASGTTQPRSKQCVSAAPHPSDSAVERVRYDGNAVCNATWR